MAPGACARPQVRYPLFLLLGLAGQGCLASPPASAVAAPSGEAWRYLAGLNALRAEGLTCPGGLRYPPNRAPLELDCRLWRAARGRLQDPAALLSAHRSAPLVDGAAAEISLLGPAAADGSLNGFMSSESHCKRIMDPRVKLIGVERGPAQPDGRHHWVQVLAAGEAPADTSCRGPAVARTAEPAAALDERRLKPGGSGGNDNSASSSSAPVEEEKDTYKGPGTTFGMVLLIIAVSIFCVGTFGSIIIGNIVLSRRARQQGDVDNFGVVEAQ